MAANPLETLAELGQSVWLDDIRRHLIESGELKRMIEDDGLRGMTSNPAIFEKAIAQSTDYDDAIHRLTREGKDAAAVYEALSVRDVQDAADAFRPVYDSTDGGDGFVSLEVNPHLARDTPGTIDEARRLWATVDRPNVMVKVPGTVEGLPAIRQLLGEGINVNVTLLFGLPRYREVVEAYLGGLEDRIAAEQPVERLASVASFFVSRIDALVDPRLEERIAAGGPEAETAKELLGQVAVASAKGAHRIHQERFGGERFQALAQKGARPQRLLWASTSTKNPAYSDVKYVEALIGPGTVNTLPMDTFHAYRDHGQPAVRLEDDLDRAARVLELLPKVGIDLDQATRQLEEEGVEKFNQPFDKLLAAIERVQSE